MILNTVLPMVKPQLLLSQTNLNRFRLGTLMHETNSASFTSPWDSKATWNIIVLKSSTSTDTLKEIDLILFDRECMHRCMFEAEGEFAGVR